MQKLLIAIMLMFGIATLSACATKPVLNKDLAAAPAASTAPAPAPAPTATRETGAEPGPADPVPVEEGTPAAGEASAGGKDSGAAVKLDVVYFGLDSYLLSAEARETLSRNAGWLADNVPARVMIEGHADERGSDGYNMALAEKRAAAVRRYLESLGVSQERLETISYGEDKPAVLGHDEAAWSKNRRAEFVIVK